MRLYKVGDRFPVENVGASTNKALSPKKLERKPESTKGGFSRSMSTILLALTYLLFLFPIVSLPLAVFCVIFGFLDSRRRGLEMVGLNPFFLVPVLSVLFATLFYFNGTARLQGVGLPGRHHENLHRELRCSSRTSGCTVFGYEIVYQFPYNLTLYSMIKTLGPMKGAYTGPYPSIDEAFALIRQCDKRVDYDDLSSNPERYGCPADLELRLLRNPYAEGETRLALVVFQDHTLIVGSEFNSFLIARDSERHYASYYFESLSEFDRWRISEDAKRQ